MAAKNESKMNRRVNQLTEYKEWADLVQQQTGKTWLTQAQEIRALKGMGGQCGVSDYYWYRLYDPGYHYGRGSPDFLGWSLQESFSTALNPRYAVLPAWDKLLFTQMASAAGLPVAPVKATFHAARHIAPVLGQHLKTLEEAAKFLRNPANYPMFGKPSFSQQGYGTAYLASYDPVADSLSQLNGSHISVDEFIKRLTHSVDPRYHKPECGFLFQECFNLAPEVKALTDWTALCGVRLMCLNTPDGAKILRSFWKIAVPPNQVDNFSMGKYGNLLADVDPATGEVGRMLGAFWPNAQLLEKHPRSGKVLAGFRLPGWDKIVEACNLGAAVFPLMKIQHWDFVLTDKGPFILELNDIASTQAAQIHGHGLLTEVSREFLKRNANVKHHPWVKAL
jgi:Sugar-transfer associated ATP-grasp